MTAASARASLAFSAIGHAYAHMFEPIFYIVALVLPGVLGLPYEEVLALVIVGKLLYGLAAPFAGWLGDRWSTVGMMSIYFLGMGLAAIGVGLSQNAWQMGVALSVLGLFGSIYHPVGIAWLVRNAVNKGKAIGINGVFGGFGPAFAGLAAGGLIALAGWRAAFIVPGIIVVLTGLAFLAMVRSGAVIEVKADRKPEPVASKDDQIKAGLLLAVTMLGGGLVYQSTQVALPKLFEMRLGDLSLFGLEGVAGISTAVMIVYLIAGGFQVLAGHLADKYPSKWVYALSYLAQVPLLFIASWIAGLPLVLVAVMMVSFNMAGIPAENVLLAKYTLARWRGTAFGFKFVLSFGVAGLAVPLVAFISGRTGGDLSVLFLILAAAAFVVIVGASLLPPERKVEHKATAKPEVRPVPAAPAE